MLAAAPTTPPCFRRWRRSSSLLHINSGRIIYNFGFQESLRTFLKPIFTRGVWNELPQSKPDSFASSLWEGAFGMVVQFSAKVQSLRVCLLPLGGAVAQRLRGYRWRSEKSVKAIAPTGAALAFLCFDFFFRFVKGVQPLETGCGTQHPLRALGGTRVLLAAAPTTPPCFRRWRRSSSLLLRGGWSPEVGRGESEHPSLPLAQRSVFAR